MGSNANEKKYQVDPSRNTSMTCRAAFSGGVDWSAILLDLWEAPGWLMSKLDHSRHPENTPLNSGCARGGFGAHSSGHAAAAAPKGNKFPPLHASLKSEKQFD
jgi:hypothetical protein